MGYCYNIIYYTWNNFIEGISWYFISRSSLLDFARCKLFTYHTSHWFLNTDTLRDDPIKKNGFKNLDITTRRNIFRVVNRLYKISHAVAHLDPKCTWMYMLDLAYVNDIHFKNMLNCTSSIFYFVFLTCKRNEEY